MKIDNLTIDQEEQSNGDIIFELEEQIWTLNQQLLENNKEFHIASPIKGEFDPDGIMKTINTGVNLKNEKNCLKNEENALKEVLTEEYQELSEDELFKKITKLTKKITELESKRTKIRKSGNHTETPEFDFIRTQTDFYQYLLNELENLYKGKVRFISKSSILKYSVKAKIMKTDAMILINEYLSK